MEWEVATSRHMDSEHLQFKQMVILGKLRFKKNTTFFSLCFGIFAPFYLLVAIDLT